jgi:hypothetical protein
MVRNISGCPFVSILAMASLPVDHITLDGAAETSDWAMQ